MTVTGGAWSGEAAEGRWASVSIDLLGQHDTKALPHSSVE
ncbi:MAG: hypothetical protein JWP65_2766 [Ramlibacter sp.]|jgi:hypothetical protein|nr:hypothetical protein [Ramlibacter sp.]